MMVEVRCTGFYFARDGTRHRCTRLLCVAEEGSRVEIRCPSCKKLNIWPPKRAETERQERQ